MAASGHEERCPPRRLSGRCGIETGRWPSMLMSRRRRLLGQVLRRGLMLIREGERLRAGAHGAVVILIFPICRLLAWLIFRCKKQRKQLGAAEGDRFAKGQSSMLAAPTRRFYCRPVPLPNLVRLIAEIWLAARISN